MTAKPSRNAAPIAPDISHLVCRKCNTPSMVWVNVVTRSVTCAKCGTPRRVKGRLVGGRLIGEYVAAQKRNIVPKDGQAHVREYKTVLALLAERGIPHQRVWDAGIAQVLGID